MRRQLFAGPDVGDFPVLHDLLAAGATDNFSKLFVFGERGDLAQGSGVVVYSFSTDRPGGFGDDDLRLLQASLPGLSLSRLEGPRWLCHCIGFAANLSRR